MPSFNYSSHASHAIIQRPYCLIEVPFMRMFSSSHSRMCWDVVSNFLLFLSESYDAEKHQFYSVYMKLITGE